MFAPANAHPFTLVIPTVRNDFKVLAFEGNEAISALYAINVELVSEYPDVDLESLLSQPAFLQFGLNGEGIHGRIENAFAGEIGRRLTRYHLTLVPALHYLQFRHDQRIFQRQTVPQIIAQVLKGHGIQADAFTFHPCASPEREYCTQYGESDFEFVQRLCAEEGIAWHHQHTQDGHRLIFTEHQSFFPTLGKTPYQQGAGMVAEHSVVSQFSMRFSTRTSQVTRRGYDLKRPSRLLESRINARFNPALEDYRYPLFQESEERGKQLVRQGLERHRADYQLAEGESDEPTLRSGHLFGLTNHPRETYNDSWLLLSVTHAGKLPQSLEEAMANDAKPEDGFSQGYRNTFTAIPWDVFYRPRMPAPRPLLVCQTARVTGPAGEEIYCDEYGRVKVEFHWDRAEHDNEMSSCWVRVSSSWAGEGFGSMTVPRIGMEVVVTFLEGNPDNPLITGCVPNKVQSVPYSLPENKTRTVLRSHSSPRSRGYNELMIEDRAGQEKIYLRAQRDIEQLVLNNSWLDVGKDRREIIKGDSIALFEGEEHRTVTADRKVKLQASDYLQIAGSRHTQIGEALVVEAGEHVHIKAGAHLVLDAGASMTLKAGGQHIVINADGVFSSSEIEVGGSPVAGLAARALMPGAVTGLLALVAPQVELPVDELEEVLEEEEEEVEEEAGITLRIGVFFDGTGNNRSNSEKAAGCYASDVNLEEAAEYIRLFCEKHGYDGKGGVPEDSYGNDSSNVAKLYELYSDDSQRLLADDETIGFIPVYLEGIGTRSGEEDSTYAKATGRGAYGVLARVEQSPSLMMEKLREFQLSNPERQIERVEFDIFGFSRGAAAARHFANDVLKGNRSILASTLASAPGFVDDFAWRTNTDVAINFIGLFDTVAAVTSFADRDDNGHNVNNPGVDLHLPSDIAKKVVHLVAHHERRHNFPLNSAGAADIVLPGVHSDLGGGYLPNAIERVLVSKPCSSTNIDLAVPSTATNAYLSTQAELGRLQRQLALYGLQLEVKTWSVERRTTAKGDRSEWKNVYAAVRSERTVSNELALVYLRIMRELAARNDVPFRAIKDKDPKLSLPAELQPIAKKLMAYALGETRHTGLSLDEDELLLRRYIHQSAHWNAVHDYNESRLDIVFINRPAENHVRVVHPNA